MQDEEDYQDKIATEVGASLRGHKENNKFDGSRRCLEQQSEDCESCHASLICSSRVPTFRDQSERPHKILEKLIFSQLVNN